ncbi:multidrug resistance-associated protein 1 [Aplysia californica]|uniref:Multidrug resistance-associated protein 1 n=1 Tax=Aplysia californica TaxID=6500 RepID=A0ABM1W2R1_APLCA|nr:multidrug resistance-associated protein 1 [Aplysia californica]
MAAGSEKREERVPAPARYIKTSPSETNGQANGTSNGHYHVTEPHQSLTMNNESRKKYTAGEIIMMVSVDAQRVQEVFRVFVLLAGTPIQLIVSAVMLYYTIGISIVAGIVFLLLLIPLNSLLGSQLRKLQAMNMKLKDRRVKLITDVLSGIKVLKLYAWEESFEEKISEIRSQEMKVLRRLAYFRIGIQLSNWMTPFLITLATFACYILISDDSHLDPATVFVSLTYFDIMRMPFVIITNIITGTVMASLSALFPSLVPTESWILGSFSFSRGFCGAAMVSLKRINKFLYGEDLDNYVGANPEGVTECVNLTFTVVSTTHKLCSSRLQCVNDTYVPLVFSVSMEVAKGSLTMVVGRVGSGKSSLLSGLLGELMCLSGSVDVKGSIAYVAQQAWIQNGTVKNNILFGSPPNEARYRAVVKACALDRDLSILPSGDRTEIGEKGVNLSGGQKQRIALARAVYSDMDLYLLDDPLSAVDAHVGKHIFQHVIGPEGLLKGKMFYLPTARQLKRMENVSKSPIYSHFGEAVGGASTIRAFGHSHRFLTESQAKIDNSVSRSLMMYSCSNWLSIMLDLIGTLFVFSAAIFAVTSDSTDAASTGLSITYSLQFALFLGFMIRQQSELTANSVSIERILEYTGLPHEGAKSSKPVPVPALWPRLGLIEFCNYEVRYRAGLDLVLKSLSVTIRPGEKVGIVGRTGAGKSSLTLALFRVLEASSGSILIDDVNIADLDLYELRAKLSILPQDPVLFTGTLRMNLDPHDEYSDADVYRALDQALLGDFVRSFADGIELEVGEEGKNLSVGQRQLVCLARALLRKNKILVLDEATAAVDVQTDAFIQETIRTAFRDCTVITIAHRLNTIMDYDKVLVMEAGEVAEFAPPRELLDNPESLFYSLATEAKLI